jgi:hypothetical protein
MNHGCSRPRKIISSKRTGRRKDPDSPNRRNANIRCETRVCRLVICVGGPSYLLEEVIEERT